MRAFQWPIWLLAWMVLAGFVYSGEGELYHPIANFMLFLGGLAALSWVILFLWRSLKE
jgi:hypothetical protein